MDLNEYITSGIIEQYVLGSVSPQERQEVECMSKIYPEIKTHLEDLQGSIEKMVTQVAEPAPEGIRAKLMAEIANMPQLEAQEIENKEETKVISLNSKASSSNKFQYLAAACLIGFVIASGAALYQNNGNNALRDQMAQNEQDLQKAKEKVVTLEQSVLYSSEQLAFVSEKNTQKIALAGTKGNESSEALVFWNPTNKKVMLDKGKLPKLEQGKQYQLWVIADGVPVDMGMLDWNEINQGMAEMKTTGTAQAFAITIEPEGGSKSPTMEAMVVIGGV